ncbi:MAG TPA: prephenate dehydrogenase [Streptosporangiaceae bacterium]
MSRAPFPRRVIVIGTGLIGTSAALALRRHGAGVWLADRDPAAARLAADLGAGEVLDAGGAPGGPADVALIAVPPAAVATALAQAQKAGLARAYTDAASVKALPVARAREAGCDLSSYVPGHPLAGRERSGPAAARADLFLGRTWALCPAAETAAEAVDAVTALVTACGAEPVLTDAATHDRWVALVSHAPHVVAAAMAAQLAPAPVADEALRLAGQGLRDATRIAVGDTALWAQILGGNATPVAEVLAAVAADLTQAAAVLADAARAETPEDVALGGLAGVLDRGRAGVARIPGKRGGPARAFTAIQVVINDRPGELARLFAAVGEAGVNIEDVGIEHSPGLPVGVAELSVRPESSDRLIAALAASGWPVRR